MNAAVLVELTWQSRQCRHSWAHAQVGKQENLADTSSFYPWIHERRELEPIRGAVGGSKARLNVQRRAPWRAESKPSVETINRLVGVGRWSC